MFFVGYKPRQKNSCKSFILVVCPVNRHNGRPRCLGLTRVALETEEISAFNENIFQLLFKSAQSVLKN